MTRSYSPAAPLEALRTHGLDPGAAVVCDGVIHRFKNAGAKGWYCFHEEFDRAWGAFGDYRSGEQWSWSSRKSRATKATAVEVEALREELNVKRQQSDDWRRREAKHVWRFSARATDDHPYLKKKRVQPHGTRHYHVGKREVAGVSVVGSLIVPVFDDSDELQAVQLILPDGLKRNIGPTTDGHFWIGVPRRWKLYVAEGFATAASVYEDTGRACCIAFGAGGLMHVAQYVRAQFDPHRLIIVADGDEAGTKAANAAARAAKALVYVADAECDYNDMARRGHRI